MNSYSPCILPQLPAYEIVLVNLPSYEDRSEFDYRRSVPPLGLGYIATYLQHRGVRAGLLDAEYYQLKPDEIISMLKRVDLHYVGVNCWSSGVEFCRTVLMKLGGVGEKRLVGGPHVSARPQDFADLPNTIAVVGYGEEVAYNIIMRHIPDTTQVVENLHLTSDIVEMKVDQSFFANKIIMNDDMREGVLISSRGCPYSCRYCMSANSKFILRTMDATIEGIQELVHGYDAQIIHFLDDIIFPSNDRVRLFINATRTGGVYGAFQ